LEEPLTVENMEKLFERRFFSAASTVKSFDKWSSLTSPIPIGKSNASRESAIARSVRSADLDPQPVSIAPRRHTQQIGPYHDHAEQEDEHCSRTDHLRGREADDGEAERQDDRCHQDRLPVRRHNP
jgi:hypothetical protein